MLGLASGERIGPRPLARLKFLFCAKMAFRCRGELNYLTRGVFLLDFAFLVILVNRGHIERPCGMCHMLAYLLGVLIHVNDRALPLAPIKHQRHAAIYFLIRGLSKCFHI